MVREGKKGRENKRERESELDPQSLKSDAGGWEREKDEAETPPPVVQKIKIKK